MQMGSSPPSNEIVASRKLFAAALPRLGSEAVTGMLLIDPDRWRHRTIVKLSVLDKLSVRWRISVDMTIPPLSQGSASPYSLYLPLVSVAKRKLADIDVEDECQQRMSVLTREGESQLSLEVAATMWNRYCKPPLQDIRISSSTVMDGDEVKVTSSALEMIAELILAAPTEAQLRLKWINDFKLLDRIEDLDRRANFNHLLNLFAGAGVLYAKIDDAKPLHRKIVKVSFRDRLPRGFRQPAKQRLAIRRIAERILQSLGVRSTPLIWVAPVGNSGSYHIEAEAPEGLVFIDSLIAEDSATYDESWSARFNVSRLDQGISGAKQIHLYRGDRAKSRTSLLHALYLRTPPSGWLLTTITASFLFALLVTLIGTSIRTLYNGNQATSVATGLLALGTFVMVLLARPLEHSFTSLLLRGTRLALVAMALASMTEIALLVRMGRMTTASASENLNSLVGPIAWVRWYCIAVCWLAFGLIFASFVSWGISRRRLSKRTPVFNDRYAKDVGLME